MDPSQWQESECAASLRGRSGNMSSPPKLIIPTHSYTPTATQP